MSSLDGNGKKPRSFTQEELLRPYLEKERVGVFVCHCGTNISKMVDIDQVVEYSRTLPGVVRAVDYKYMCSDPGQELIRKEVAEHSLTRVVVSSCSPLMHEITFRHATADAGLNEFFMQMANIREQVSWVTADVASATEKAKKLIRGAVYRVVFSTPLDVRKVPVNPATLVLGAGITGIEAALKLAEGKHQVYLVDQKPTIGGHMAMFDKTFPTLDCAACILTPKMVSVGRDEHINLRTFAEVEEVSGFVGNFKVKIRSKSRYVDVDKCNGCGACWNACPASFSPSQRKMTIGGRVFKVRKFGGNNGNGAH